MNQYEHLAACLTEARGGRSRREVAKACGVAENTIARYESGAGFRGIPTKMRALAAHYGWRPGALEAVLAGGQPPAQQPASRPIGPGSEAAERQRIVELIGGSSLPVTMRKELIRVIVTEHAIAELHRGLALAQARREGSADIGDRATRAKREARAQVDRAARAATARRPNAWLDGVGAP